MSTPVNVPPLGESVAKAKLIRWHKADGETVKVDEPLCELETDKANVDIPSPIAGTLHRLRKEGESVAVGDPIGKIDPPAEGSTKSPVNARTEPDKTQLMSQAKETSGPKSGNGISTIALSDFSPAVRNLIDTNRLDAQTVAAIPASGPHGRLTEQDVQAYLGNRKKVSDGIGSKAAAPPPLPTPPMPHTKKPTLEFDSNGISQHPMSKIRKRIAERLITAQQTAAILTTINEIDMTGIQELRIKYKERFTELHGVGLGFMSFFARACVSALREFPNVNAFIEGDDIVYHNYVHLGIAVSTDRGLAVPVLRNVESMSFARIESEIKRLAAATREGKLGIGELSGGTFTITNGGIFGSLLSTPILSPPQSGILGMHAVQPRPMAINGKVEIRPMMYVALSYDHRLVDGRESVSFLVRLKQLLEDPARLLLEV